MLGTIYTGQAGMNAYSKGLDVISNNVANLNTIGFKASIATFADTVYRNNTGATLGSAGNGISGAGVEVNADAQNFAQGQTRSTDNPLDAALDGNGFFVLERDGQRYYTRAGQFSIEEKDGYLIESNSKAQVMMSVDGGPPGKFQIDPYRNFVPRATASVNLSGTLSRTDQSTFDIPSLVVNDSSGAKQTLKVHFQRSDTDPLSWTVEVSDASSTANPPDAVLATGTLKFNEDGTPAQGSDSMQVTMTPDKLPAFTFALNFGTAGQYNGITSMNANNTTSQVTMLHQDGLELGTLTGATFDERGNLRASYTNGETKTIGRLVLARIDSGGGLTSVGSGLYIAKEGTEPTLGAALESGLGSISSQKLELSNVELTNQFTDLIIIQRGYQASSQMTSVANEMMQQLLAMQDHK